MTALGASSDCIEYMMGHVVDTCHDVQMKGVESLRNVYAASDLCIKPRTQVSKIEALKESIVQSLLQKSTNYCAHNSRPGETHPFCQDV